MTRLSRGRVYAAELGDYGEKFYLVVSNNQRNVNFDSVLAVRLTTTKRATYPQSWVAMSSADHPLVGHAVCDDIVEIYEDEVRRDLGAPSAATMTRVGAGLKAALALP